MKFEHQKLNLLTTGKFTGKPQTVYRFDHNAVRGSTTGLFMFPKI